jgi:hypothetical protein
MGLDTLSGQMTKRNDVTVKVDVEAVRIAKIAASYKDMSLAEYISTLIMTHAPGDIDEGHSQLPKAVSKQKPESRKGQ